MVALTFPDGARRDYPDGITGTEVAKAISPSLAKRTVAMALDGALADLADPIARDAKIEFLTRDDPRALELIRHDAAHVSARLPPAHAPHHGGSAQARAGRRGSKIRSWRPARSDRKGRQVCRPVPSPPCAW